MKIGELRSSLFVSYDCKWNGLVRDITAANESYDEEVNEPKVYIDLLEVIKENAILDRQFPQRSRIQELFVDSDAK